MNEKLAKLLEPGSSTPVEGLEALSLIKREAPTIQVGVNFMPIIPFLEDDVDNIKAVIQESSKAGADFILFSPGVSLQDNQKEFFIRKLRNSTYSHVIQKLLDLYAGKLISWNDYFKDINSKISRYCKEFSLPLRMKRWIPKDYRKWNYLISESLLNKYYHDTIKGRIDKTLMWAGLNLNNLNESIIDIYNRGNLSSLKGFNSKIIEIVELLLQKNKDITQKRGLDKFL